MPILRRNAKGLTLVELITVSAIIASVAGAGVLSLAMLDGKRLEADGRTIVGNLSWAREMAVNMRQNYIIDFDTAASTYTVYRGSVAAANEMLRQRVQTTLSSVTPSSQITFSPPLGTSTDTAITFDQNGRTRQVMVFGATGYVRMQ